MLPAPVVVSLIEELGSRTGREVRILSQSSLGGGCINTAVKVLTTEGPFFLKFNSATAFPGMFESEAEGLKTLSAAAALHVPEVLFTGTAGDYSFLVLEYVEAGSPRPRFQEDFGASLAMLHRNTKQLFGFGTDNYIGSLPQSNREHPSWTDFFILERLEPMTRMARDQQRIRQETVTRFEWLYFMLPRLFPHEPPALLHGDLWSGNYLVGQDGKAVLIDPAVYYGHREMDLAMTRLFGGFRAEFYAAYQSAFPLEKEWEQRMDLCNLYPLMVHVNLFGGGYGAEVESILRKFV